MGFWSRSKANLAESIQKFKSRRSTRIRRRRTTRSRGVITDNVDDTSSSPSSLRSRKTVGFSTHNETRVGKRRSRLTTTILGASTSVERSRSFAYGHGLHPGISAMTCEKVGNRFVPKSVAIQNDLPPPWCDECMRQRASNICKDCVPPSPSTGGAKETEKGGTTADAIIKTSRSQLPCTSYCDTCCRAVHVGLKSMRNHRIRPHPLAKSYEGYMGTNDPDSPALRPLQHKLRKMRPPSRLRETTTAANATSTVVAPRVFTVESERTFDPDAHSRPRFRIANETYTGDVVVFKSNLVRREGPQEVRGRVLQLRYSTKSRRSYLVRFDFVGENGYRRSSLETVAEKDLETPEENRKRKLRHATINILHRRLVLAFDEWRGMSRRAREREARAQVAFFLQRRFRGACVRKQYLEKRDQRRRENNHAEKEARRAERARRRRLRKLFGRRRKKDERAPSAARSSKPTGRTRSRRSSATGPGST